MKKLINISMVSILTIFLIATAFVMVSCKEASAITDTLEITAENVATKMYVNDNDGMDWPDIHNATEADGLSSAPGAGFTCDGNTDEYSYLFRSVIQFDMSSYDVDYILDNAISIQFETLVTTEVDTYTGGTPPEYGLVWVKGEPYAGYGSAMSLYDYDLMGIHTISDTLNHSEISTGTETWTIEEAHWPDVFVDSNNWGILSLREIQYDKQNIEPTWSSGQETYIACNIAYTKLVITYYPEPDDRDIDITINDDVDITVDGSEVATSIGWESPRCAYADEQIGFLISGDSGASLDLELRDGSGYTLETHTDSIRVDGYYYWTVDLDDTVEGYLRCYELNNNIYSTWGYVMPRPDGTQPVMSVMVKDTDYPQYEQNWEYFRANESDVQIIHYKTNIDGSTDLADYSFRVWYLADSGYEIYNETLADIADDYYEHVNTLNDAVCHWRYLLFSFNGDDDGLDDKDGLIYDLTRTYSFNASGFYQALIYEDGVGEATTTESAYWYNESSSDGISISLDKSKYMSEDPIVINMHVGAYSHVLDDLNELTIEMYRDGVSVYEYDSIEVDSEYEYMTYTSPVFFNSEYELRFTFSGDGSFEYIKVIGLNTEYSGDSSGSGSSAWFDVLGGFSDSLASFGLDSDAGKIFVTILVMVGFFFIFRGNKYLRSLVPSLVLCMAILFGWIPVWLVVLSGVVFGLLIFFVISKIFRGGE